MKYYIYKVVPVKDNFNETASFEDNKILGQHFEYLKELLEKQILLLAGPCADAAFGIVIFIADSIKNAEKIMCEDPAVKFGIMIAELHEFRLSLYNGKSGF